MPNHERIMLSYARLAAISHNKGQLNPRDKFLILTGASACRAGWPDVAEQCRKIILSHNPRHLIGQSAAFVEALRSSDFVTFLTQLERFCLPEKAEHLLTEMGIDVSQPEAASEQTTGDVAMALLAFD